MRKVIICLIQIMNTLVSAHKNNSILPNFLHYLQKLPSYLYVGINYQYHLSGQKIISNHICSTKMCFLHAALQMGKQNVILSSKSYISNLLKFPEVEISSQKCILSYCVVYGYKKTCPIFKNDPRNIPHHLQNVFSILRILTERRKDSRTDTFYSYTLDCYFLAKKETVCVR